MKTGYLAAKAPKAPKKGWYKVLSSANDEQQAGHGITIKVQYGPSDPLDPQKNICDTGWGEKTFLLLYTIYIIMYQEFVTL